MRGATQRSVIEARVVVISIHAPREGSDQDHAGVVAKPEGISIHAPREGSDQQELADKMEVSNFNPRSP